MHLFLGIRTTFVAHILLAMRCSTIVSGGEEFGKADRRQIAVGMRNVGFQGGDGYPRRKATAAGKKTAKRAESPTADFKPFQAKTIGTQEGIKMLLLDAKRRTDLALDAAECAKLVARSLERFKLPADLVDQFACTAKIDGMLAAVFTVAEPIVRTEGFSIAAAIGRGDMSLCTKEFGPKGQKSQRRVNELVSRSLIFHFQTPLVISLFGKTKQFVKHGRTYREHRPIAAALALAQASIGML